MPKLHFSRTVPFSPEQMLALISDLESYPEFVPNCSAMEVSNRIGEPVTSCDARMLVEFGPVSQDYTSEVTIDREAMIVTAHAINGPFSHLDSQWSFSPNEQGTMVTFDIDFKIANPILAAIAEPAFVAKQDQILDAFMDEARRRYA